MKHIFFKIKNKIKKFDFKSISKKHKIKKVIEIDNKSRENLLTKNHLHHFTLENINSKIGDKFLITKVIKKSKDKVVYDFLNSFIVECTSTKNNHNYYDIKEDDFKNSNFLNVTHLISEMTNKYGSEDILNLGVNLYKFKFLEKLESIESKITNKKKVRQIDKILDEKIEDISKKIFQSEISEKVLNQNKEEIEVFEKNEIKSIRGGFGDGLYEASKKNKNIVALVCDLKDSLKLTKFEKEFKNRFFEMGICEQNMASAAAGMCINNKIPFICSFAVFSPTRNLDQIRVSICYSNHNVKVIGGHAGLLTGEDGGTHQSLEDVSIMRSLPNMKVLVPSDYYETYKATIEISKIKSPCYLRLSRAEVKSITKKSDKFEIGKINVLYEKGYDIIIIACGVGCQISLESINLLEKENIKITILNSHTIKPLDKKTILKYANYCNKIITIEEHQIIGGLGGAVCELLSKEKPSYVERIGVDDKFGQSGEGFELLKKYNISKEEILKRAKILLKK